MFKELLTFWWKGDIVIMMLDYKVFLEELMGKLEKFRQREFDFQYEAEAQDALEQWGEILEQVSDIQDVIENVCSDKLNVIFGDDADNGMSDDDDVLCVDWIYNDNLAIVDNWLADFNSFNNYGRFEIEDDED